MPFKAGKLSRGAVAIGSHHTVSFASAGSVAPKVAQPL